ncbi:long-chain-fatty-acid--CoA ligase [Williamsia deligens]|uniref:Long-chain-fatty-acid--CoA ligase n=1 Tax=Williamsia deligens TaxID=321325 RepID=A0ABW3G3Z6_9NOCA|nr:long-chain-fatty-acid--CoA ligase [Williamsia deligens]MCP2194368.1 fatty-acyl-CoA synthase [Williamsia deligens]
MTEEFSLADLLERLDDVDDRGVRCAGGETSWRDHVATARRWARALRADLDPARPPHVAVLLDNTPDFAVVLSAAALDGLVVVGLNTTRRGAALARDIALSDCQLVLTTPTTEPLLDGVPLGDARHVDVSTDAWAARVQAQSDGPLDPVHRPCPRDLFMLIFTSGTSGHPKAVRCDHAKVSGAGRMLAGRFRLGHDDVVYLAMPMFHSNAVIAGWGVAVAAGASIALRERFSASGFLPDVRRFGVTYANYVGKPLSYVLATPARPDDADNPLRVVYGNEASPSDIVAFSERFGVRVVDGFGSTEGGVAIGRTPDTPAEALGPLTPPVEVVDIKTGLRCPAAEFDSHGRLLNADVAVGEIVNTAGAGAFTGYYGDADADAERMRGGVYHSGDLAYVDRDGYVHFAGRIGDWVRVDGENVGTGPIERILLRHGAIRLASVYGIGTDIGDEIVASIVVGDLTAAGLSEFLAAQSDLGPKQWPRHICVVDELPTTATFKVLRRDLAASTPTPTWTLDPATRTYR